MRNKHSIGWHTVQYLNRKIKKQRAAIVVLSVLLAILSVWLCISGGR
jgi:hypothetical protein